MTLDAAHIQEEDTQFLNKRRARKGEPPVEPIYTTPDAERAATQLVGQEYEARFEVVPGVTARLVEAGHMLGSAGVVLDIEEKGRRLRLMFSGDIGRRDLPLLRDPVLPHDVDILIMEATYGDMSHDTPALAYDQLLGLIRRGIKRGGKIIIPAFAVGRAQTLVYYLHLMFDHGDLPHLPVYVDSPLATNVTDIFRQHQEDFDEETLAFTRRDPGHSPFGFDMLTYTRSVEESKAINDVKEPVIIISASGMAETGRILHHLRNNIEEPRNMIILTSWMAPDTLGRRLLEGNKQVKIFGEEFEVRAEVAHIDGLSAHAGQDFLLTYANALRGRVKQVFLVHGEPRPVEILRQKMDGLGAPIHYPALGDEVEV
jgi:metallo-beta-lactamase family protein